jgi:hypothetical protein
MSENVAVSAQQVTLMTPNVMVQPGSNVHFDIKVKNFLKISAVQFSLKWNKDVVEFIGVDNFNLPGLVTDLNFGLLNTSKGELRFSWVQGDLSGVTLKDSAQLFSIWYKAIGADKSNTKVSFANDPIVIEVINANGAQPFTLENGTIEVKTLTPSSEVISNDFVLYQNAPNPFSESTVLKFDLKKGVETNIRIYDHLGKVIFEENRFYPAGKQSMTLGRELFGKAGTYFFNLSTPAGSASRQLVVN